MLRSTLPAAPAPEVDGPRGEEPTGGRGDVPLADLWREVRSADDSDRGWGRDDAPPDDDRILREKPPHW